MNNWKKILNELSYRVSSGIPDLTNEQHLIKLWDILKEHNWNIDARVELLKRIDEQGKERLCPICESMCKRGETSAKTGCTPASGQASQVDKEKETGQDEPKEAGSSRKNIDAIDGETKKKALNKEEKAPGNESSVINEIGVGIGMSHIDENPNITPEELEEKLFKEMMDTKIGKSNKEKATRNACRAAAISAIREHSRTQQTIEKNDMSSENTKVSHVFGAKSSLENTVKHLEEAGVKEVNGIPFEKYKEIILGGGAGKNPTDTMVVMLDDSVDPPKCIINHTSNKTSSDDIQGNSGPDKNADYIMNQADKDVEAGNITKEEHKKIIEEMTALRENFINAQNQIEELISQQFGRMKADIEDPKKRKELIEKTKKLSGSKPPKGPAAKWELLAKRYGDIKGKEFDYKTGTYTPPLSEEEETKIITDYYNEMEALATSDDDVSEPSKAVQQIMALEGMYPPPTDELNDLYREQHTLISQTREKVDNIKEGYGTRIAAQNVFERLHLDIVQGHNPGGIPAENFETNMGINKSGRRYDKDGNAWHHTGAGNYKKINPETGEPEGDSQKGKALGLTEGNKAVVVNQDTIAKALGVKPPAEGILDRISVGEVKSGKGKSGVATIYGIDVNNKKIIIGYQTIRPKQGIGSKHQDTIQFHPDFQKKLVEESEKL